MVKIHQSFSVNILLGPVARSDARPPGMQTVAGSILRWVTFFVEIGHGIISTAILFLALIQTGQLSITGALSTG